MNKKSNNFKVVDLFAGAGGLSTGMELLGCKTALCIDNDRFSVETLRRNKSDKTVVLQSDLFEFDTQTVREHAGLTAREPFLLVGGPPCQPFSKNSYWTESGDDAKYRRLRSQGVKVESPAPLAEPRDDRRRFLIDVYADAVRDAKPSAFLFENVASILHPRNKVVFIQFLERLQNYGYSIVFRKVLALEYGIAQKRERVFVLGFRGKNIPKFAPPTHQSTIAPDSPLAPMPTVGDVLKKIKFREEDGIEVAGRWAEALREIPPGMNYKALTSWAGHPRPLFEAETRFWNFLLKLSPDLPSWTIASQPGPWIGPFHWDNRRLTTAEMAAIQGFPVGYKFEGPRRERVRQIGNAVPPAFAAAIASLMVQEISG